MDENLLASTEQSSMCLGSSAEKKTSVKLQEVAGTKERKGKSWSSRRRPLRYFEINDCVCTIRLPTCWIMGGGIYVADSVEDKLSCSSRTGEKIRGLE